MSDVVAGRPPALAGLPRPVSWVFTAGFARTPSQVGMAEVLLAAGLRPDAIVGSSLGAINAAALHQVLTTTAAQGTGAVDLAPLSAMWELLGTESLLASPGTAAVRGFAPRTGRSTRELRSIVATVIPPDLPVPHDLHLVCSDLETGRSKILRKPLLLDAVLASAALPVLFPPVTIDDRLYLDGGLTAAAPIEEAHEAGAASIILLDTGASAVTDDDARRARWWEIAALSYLHQIRGQLAHSLTRVGRAIPVVTISTDEGDLLDLSDSPGQVAAGRDAAERALAGGLSAIDPSAPGLHGVPIGVAPMALPAEPRMRDRAGGEA